MVVQDPDGSWNTSTNRYTANTNGMRNIKVRLEHRVTNPFIIGVDGNWCYTIKARLKLNGSYVQEYTPQILVFAGPLQTPQGLLDLYKGHKADTTYGLDYDETQESKNLFNYDDSIYMSINDYIEVEYVVMIGKHPNGWKVGTEKGQNVFSTIFDENNAGGLFDGGIGGGTIAGLRGLGTEDSTANLSDGYVGVLESSSLGVSRTGILNNQTISDGGNNQVVIDYYEFEDYITTKEMENILLSPQKAVSLKNLKNNVDSKLWTYTMEVNVNSGLTKFGLFSNIDNL